MSNEKKYGLTLSELQVLIGVASFEASPENATLEVAGVYNTIATQIYGRIAGHLYGSDPLPEDKLIYARKLNDVCKTAEDAWTQIVRFVIG